MNELVNYIVNDLNSKLEFLILYKPSSKDLGIIIEAAPLTLK